MKTVLKNAGIYDIWKNAVIGLLKIKEIEVLID
jgi:hypothetical protein